MPSRRSGMSPPERHLTTLSNRRPRSVYSPGWPMSGSNLPLTSASNAGRGVSNSGTPEKYSAAAVNARSQPTRPTPTMTRHSMRPPCYTSGWSAPTRSTRARGPRPRSPWSGAARASRRKEGGGANLAELARDLAPGLAGVLADVDFAEQAEGDDAGAVRRMGRQAPHRGIGPGGQGKASPALAAVVRAEHFAGLTGRRLTAPGEHDTRIVGIHGDAARIGQGPARLHADRRPRLPAIVTPEHLAVRAHVDAGRS